MLLASIVASAFAIECAKPVSEAELEDAMTRAEGAWRDLDDTGFRDQVNEVAGLLLPCVGQALSPDDAARYHLLMAMHLNAVGDVDNAKLAVQAAKTIKPDYVFDDSLLPPTHELRAQWATLPTEPETKKVPEPRAGSLSFDGAPSRFRPSEQPTIAQVLDPSGLATRTVYLGAHEALPPYAAIPRQRNMLIGCGATAAALSATMYGLAWDRRSHLVALESDGSSTKKSLEGAQLSTNLLTFSSGLFLGVGIGCGVGAGVIGQR